MIFVGESSYDFAGSDISSAGDVNQDGYDDLLVGAFSDDDVGTNAGAAYLILGGCDGAVGCGRIRTGLFASVTLMPSSPDEFDLADADAKITGEKAGDYAGISISDAGDINHDGFPDIMVAASRDDTAATDA